MKPVHLVHALLGPKFSAQTEVSFYQYVSSLKEEKAIKAPTFRIKKMPITHKLNSSTKLCDHCGKKARSEKAKCSGKKQIPVDTSESSALALNMRNNGEGTST